MLRTRYKNFILYSKDPVEDPDFVIRYLFSDLDCNKLDRGEVKFLNLLGRSVAVKKYTHGGILRAITSDLYLSEKRLLNEVRTIEYLRDNGLLCPQFLLGIVQESKIFKRLFLITERLEGFRPLIDVLKDSKGLDKLKHLYRFADLFRRISELGLYHPDLHLRNVLSGPKGVPALIDFDRAKIKDLTSSEVEKMVLRLFRYIEKMEDKRDIFLTEDEKLFFLRAFQRLTNLNLSKRLTRGLRLRRLWYKISWSFESLIYGGKS